MRRCPVGQDGSEDVVEQRSALEVARGDVGQRLVIVDQREVELAGLEPRDQPLQVIVDDRQRHLWVAAPEPRERRRHERGERGREAPEAQPPVAPAGDLAELLLGVVEPREDPGRVARQGVAGLGQLDRARAALDQRQPDLPLQRGDVLAHGRLRERQRVGRGRERPAGGDL